MAVPKIASKKHKICVTVNWKGGRRDMKWSQTSRFCEWLGNVYRALKSCELIPHNSILAAKTFKLSQEEKSFCVTRVRLSRPLVVEGEHHIWQRITNEKVILRRYAGRHETKTKSRTALVEEIGRRKKRKLRNMSQHGKYIFMINVSFPLIHAPHPDFARRLHSNRRGSAEKIRNHCHLLSLASYSLSEVIENIFQQWHKWKMFFGTKKMFSLNSHPSRLF